MTPARHTPEPRADATRLRISRVAAVGTAKTTIKGLPPPRGKRFAVPATGVTSGALTYFTLDTRVQPAGIPPDVPAISAPAARKPPQCRGAIYDARTPHARTTNGRGGMGGFPAYFFSATVPATERACGRRVSARRRSSRTSVRDRRGQHRRGPLGRPQRRHPNGRRWRCNGGRSG